MTSSSAARVTAELVVASLGVALVIGAVAATQPWMDRHFLPSFLFPHDSYVVIETVVRYAMVGLGLWLVVSTRRRLGRVAARAPGLLLKILLAVVVALAASEVALRSMHLRPTEWQSPDEEPRRQADPRLGWTLVPARVGHNTIGGRTVDYAIDPAGYRVARVERPVDPTRRTIVCVGESVMFGEGLTWEESIPAQLESMTGIQSANLGVHGFGNDQAFLHLRAELPKFRQPVAIVSIFMPALFGRNLDSDRPHLGPGLTWEPARPRSRLATLASLLVPYRRDETVDRGVQMTRDVLRATVELARARGATAVIVVPHFGPEAENERLLRTRVLDETGLPYVLVPLDPSWRLPWDRHPDARAAKAIATAIAVRVGLQ